MPFQQIAIVLGIIIFVLILMTGYVKASTDEMIIISGFKKNPRYVSGRATIKFPFLERKDRLTLRVVKIDVKTEKPVPTNEFIDVSVDSVVVAKISDDSELVKLASQNFLNKNEDYIMNMVKDVLEGNIREIIGTMTLRDMISDRQAFADKVQKNAVPDMQKMGIEIVSFNVQNFWDENGIIADLGVENTARIKRDASIVRAESERDVKIAQAKANKQSNDEEVKSRQEIAEKQHELDLKIAELKKSADTKKAEADTAYEIQKENQRKLIEIASADANLARQEKEIELQEREVRIEEQRLDGQIKKKAEAESYARNKIADAELYETTNRAKAEIEKAKANRIAKEEEAIGIKAINIAEAEGIKARGLAEAEGIDKKAEAMAKMKEAAILEMFFDALPEIAKNVASPLNNVDSITMYGSGNTAQMIEDITKATTQITTGLSDGLGFDVKSMLAGFLGGNIGSRMNTMELREQAINKLSEKTTPVLESVNDEDSTEIIEKGE